MSGSKLRIVVASHGWVFIGRYHVTMAEVVLTDAYVIRRWGTSRGLGQLCEGRTEETILDNTGTVRLHPLNVVMTMDCNPDRWRDLYPEIPAETPLPEPSGIQIVIASHGWVLVGQTDRSINEISISNSRVIRRWGTTEGLGQIALNGPTSETILDPSGTVRIHPLGVVATIDCVDARWSTY